MENIAAADVPTRARYLPRMLGDPVRAVRIEAARALAGVPERSLTPDDRARFDAALAEYMAGALQADLPEAHANLGLLYLARGDDGAAIAQLRKALVIDPAFVPAYVNLADLYRARGVDGEAEAVLRAGIARVPDAAALHHALGLVLIRQKRVPDALKELTEASRLAPDDARLAYVRAVALNDAGQPREAMAVLESTLDSTRTIAMSCRGSRITAARRALSTPRAPTPADWWNSTRRIPSTRNSPRASMGSGSLGRIARRVARNATQTAAMR